MIMLRAILRNTGINPRRLVSSLRGWRRYVRERAEFRRLAGDGGMPWGRELPMLTEWNESSGGLGGYFFQDQLAARWILDAAPRRHVDAGSRLDGFIGSMSVFREVEVLDIRPQPQEVRNVKFHQLDLMRPLPDEWLECTDSLSCLHTIEHFGLGRYGDSLDADGHLKGLAQLKKMVEPGGRSICRPPSEKSASSSTPTGSSRRKPCSAGLAKAGGSKKARWWTMRTSFTSRPGMRWRETSGAIWAWESWR